jgi:hypothetical protein
MKRDITLVACPMSTSEPATKKPQIKIALPITKSVIRFSPIRLPTLAIHDAFCSSADSAALGHATNS